MADVEKPIGAIPAPNADPLSSPERAMKRWSSLTNERSSWISHYKEVSDVLLPRSGRFFAQDRNKGNKRHNNIYDTAATRANRVLAAGMMGGATSPARPWMRLEMADRELMRYAPVKLWCSEATRILLDIFQRSNTYRTLHQMYGELGGFGTGASIMLDDFQNVIHHYPLTAGEYCLASNYKGIVDTIYREFDKTVGELVREFGYKNCSLTVRNHWDAGNYDVWITIIHGIEPRVLRDGSKKDALNMPFRSFYFEKGENENKMLRESGFKKFRALTPRWELLTGDTYGNSPGMEALGHIKQLQFEALRKGEVIDQQTRPPLQGPTSLKGQALNRLPGGYSSFDSTQSVKTLFDVNLRLDHLLADIQDVRSQIRETFYTDLFLMLSQSGDSRKTATEVVELHEEKLLMLGPVLERLHNEGLDPLVTMTFDRALEAGLLPPPPEEMNGQEVNIVYTSMLAQAQRAVNTNAVDRFVTNLGAIAGVKPGVLDKFDEDKWADIYADMLGVDPQLIVADDKVAIVRKQRAEQQQAMAQAQTLQAGAETASKLGNTPMDAPSALTEITKMFSGYN